MHALYQWPLRIGRTYFVQVINDPLRAVCFGSWMSWIPRRTILDSGGLQAPVAHPPSAPNASAATLTSEARRVGVADTAAGSRGDGSDA